MGGPVSCGRAGLAWGWRDVDWGCGPGFSSELIYGINVKIKLSKDPELAYMSSNALYEWGVADLTSYFCLHFYIVFSGKFRQEGSD